MSTRLSPLAFAFALAVTTLSRGALAQDASVANDAAVTSPQRSSDDEARRAFEQAMPLLNEQRFAEAAPLLERSVALREHPAALAALAAAYRGTGRYLRAIAMLERLHAINTDPTREAEVRTVMDECRHALTHVTLRTVGEASEVLVDGERVSTGDGVRTLTLDPGVHRFEVRRVGYQPVQEERRLGIGEAVEVALDASAHPMPATLVVETPDATTVIRVDGAPLGRGRATTSATSGRHAILVSWDDGHTQERVVELAPGARMVVSVTPNRPPSIWTRWWFWTGVGAVAAGAVAVGVYAATRPDAPPNGSWATVTNAVLTY